MKLLLPLIISGFLYLNITTSRESNQFSYYHPYGYRIMQKIKTNFLKHGHKTGETPPPIDLLYVIDASFYYRYSYRDALRAIRTISSFFSISPGTTRVAIITYNENVTTYSTFSRYHNRVALHKLLDSMSKNSLLERYRYSHHYHSEIPNKYLKSNIGSAMEKAADLFKTSFTRPNTLKLLVTFTSGKDESGSDRVKFKSAMNSLTDQGIKRLVFAASKTNVVKELSFNKYQNLFLLSAYRLTNVAYRLWSYLPRKDNYRRCYKHGEVVDECNRRCVCFYGWLRNCKRVRYEFNSMPRNEKLRYVKTLLKLTTDAIHKPRYEDFIRIHSRNFESPIHEHSEFLPWHRWFILEMENLLKEVDCRVTVPYWDWSLVSNDPFNSTMLFNDDYLGSHPVGLFSCVENGPFGTKAGWTKEAGGCLERSFRGKPPSVPDVQRVVNSPSFRRFEVLLRVALHDFVHCVIGGTMCTIDSANAPSFFLHHSFIDKIWWDGQQKNKEFYEGIFKNQTENMVASPYRPNQFLNLNQQPGYINVGYANATVNSATRVTKMIRKMTTTQLEKMPRVKIPMSQLSKAFKVFKVTDQERSIAINYWLTTENHPIPRRKLTGLSSQLGFRF